MNEKSKFELSVSEKAQRPARMDGTCFYCKSPIGEQHGHGCVLVVKKANVRAIIEYEITVPAHWEAEDIEFHRNDGSWCADNAIQELENLIKKDESCLCPLMTYQCLSAKGKSFLREE